MAKYKFIKEYVTQVGLNATSNDVNHNWLFKTLHYNIGDIISGEPSRETIPSFGGSQKETYKDVIVVQNIYKDEVPPMGIKTDAGGQSRFSVPIDVLTPVSVSATVTKPLTSESPSGSVAKTSNSTTSTTILTKKNIVISLLVIIGIIGLWKGKEIAKLF